MARIVSHVRLAVASPFLATGAVLTVAGYAVTFLAELIAGRDSDAETGRASTRSDRY